jgi:hypothetical protein
MGIEDWGGEALTENQKGQIGTIVGRRAPTRLRVLKMTRAAVGWTVRGNVELCQMEEVASKLAAANAMKGIVIDREVGSARVCVSVRDISVGALALSRPLLAQSLSLFLLLLRTRVAQ